MMYERSTPSLGRGQYGSSLYDRSVILQQAGTVAREHATFVSVSRALLHLMCSDKGSRNLFNCSCARRGAARAMVHSSRPTRRCGDGAAQKAAARARAHRRRHRCASRCPKARPWPPARARVGRIGTLYGTRQPWHRLSSSVGGCSGRGAGSARRTLRRGCRLPSQRRAGRRASTKHLPVALSARATPLTAAVAE